MTTVLNLGVVDLAYGDSRGKDGAKTTAEVARILEDRYGVMATFYETRKEQIADKLAGSVSDAIDTLVSTGRNVMPTFEAEQWIENEFRQFLSADEMSKLVAGLSESERQYFLDSTGGFSGAASRGVSHRKKHPHSKKNKARPAFIDTGLYQQSFRAWTSDE